MSFKIFLRIVLISNVISLSTEQPFLRRQEISTKESAVIKVSIPRRVVRSYDLFSTDPAAVEARRRSLMDLLDTTKRLLGFKTESPAPPSRASRRAVSATHPITKNPEPGNLFSADFVENAMKKFVSKKLKLVNVGSVAAGIVGLLWPGPMGPVVSALLAPAVFDMVNNKG